MDREIVHKLLRQQLLAANDQAKLASERFNAIIREVPSGIPPPDGVQRIRDSSRSYGAAREAVMTAMKRLNDFVIHGIVPDDLE